MSDVRVRYMRLIVGNPLNTSLLILMIIAHIYSLLRISYVLMSLYRGGTDRVVMDQFGFVNVCGNGQEAGEWGGDTEFFMRTVRYYDADQDCEVYEE